MARSTPNLLTVLIDQVTVFCVLIGFLFAGSMLKFVHIVCRFTIICIFIPCFWLHFTIILNSTAMIFGIGTDIIEVQRVGAVVAKGSAFTDRIFTPPEVEKL